MTMAAVAAPPIAAGRGGSRGYPWLVVAILTMVYTVAFIDRQVLNLVIEPIKRTMLISDTRMSLLQGLAFTCAYVAFSPIMGRLADRANRRNVLIAAIIVWSLFTAAAGWSTGFWSFFVSRVGVGAAEAAVTPVAWSMLADTFARDRLPRAMSVFLIGPYIGAGLALIFGGLLLGSADHIAAASTLLAGREPWQIVFIVIGAPGVLLGLLLFAVREPVRARVVGGGEVVPLAEVVQFFWAGRAFFVRFYGAMTGIVIILYGLPSWMPTLLMRRHGVDPRTLGLQYGALVLIAGSVGVLSGPFVGRWLERRGHRAAAMLVAAIAAAALVPVSIMISFAPSYAIGLALAGAATFLFSLPQAMAASALQMAMPPDMRGVAASLYVFLCAVVGLGIAPTVVALLTDYAFAGQAGLGASLGVVCAGAAAVATWLSFGAARHFQAAIARAADPLAAIRP